jgi:hypothetical protein
MPLDINFGTHVARYEGRRDGRTWTNLARCFDRRQFAHLLQKECFLLDIGLTFKSLQEVNVPFVAPIAPPRTPPGSPALPPETSMISYQNLEQASRPLLSNYHSGHMAGKKELGS